MAVNCDLCDLVLATQSGLAISGQVCCAQGRVHFDEGLPVGITHSKDISLIYRYLVWVGRGL